MGNQALLVIDVQTGFIDGQFAVHEADTMLNRVSLIIEKAREVGVPIIFVQHNEDLDNDGPIHPRIEPRVNDYIVSKMTPDSFFETNLREILTELGVSSLVIVGFQTDYCINSTARRASKLGYKVTVIGDAHSTIDSDEMTAEAIISEHNCKFKEIASVISHKEVSFD